MSEGVYNPLSKLNIGKSVAEALLAKDPHPLGNLPDFTGAGIYVIYYRGPHPAYQRLAEANAEEWKVPIYIGKASPEGVRMGSDLFTDVKGKPLRNRLRKHGATVTAAQNLEIADFAARWIIVDDIWIPLGETLLISKFHPVWNLYLDGFGNNDPGGGRRAGARPMWHELHPGQDWALKHQPYPVAAAELAAGVTEFLARQEMPEDPHIEFAPPGV